MFDPQTMADLSAYWSSDGTALTFYYSAPEPENLARRNTLLTGKEQVRELIRANSDKPKMRALFDRLERRIEDLSGDVPRSLAIFASVQPELWTELSFESPVGSREHVGNSLVIAPLVGLNKDERYFVLLLDRSVTRLIFVEQGKYTERTKEFGPERLPVRETGTGRKVSDERSKDDDTYHHLRDVGTRLYKELEQDRADYVFVGCRKELWPEIEAAVPDNLLKKVLGHFHCDPGLVSLEALKTMVDPLVAERQRGELDRTLEAISGGRGTVGSEAVAKAVETGEAQEIFVSPHEAKAAAVCSSCGHIEIENPAQCTLCGNSTRSYPDLEEILARRAISGSPGFRHVPERSLDARSGGFAALLRFRAERSNTGAIRQPEQQIA